MKKIIAGTTSRSLAKSLALNLGIQEISVSIERYLDQELKVQLAEDVCSDDIIIVQSTSKPANDHLMELLLLVDAARRLGARRVIACVPYFGYSRQDRPSYKFAPISASLVASIMETAGIDHLVTLDLHSQQIEGFFKIGVQNLDTIEVFASHLKNRPNLMIISPDIGGTIRAKKLSGLLGTDLAVINKTRKSSNTCEMESIIGNVQGFECVIVDDIIDTGQTLCKAAEILINQGASCVEVMASHAVFSGDSLKNIENSAIKKVTVTNSIEQKILPKKFNVIDIAPIVSNYLNKLIRN